MAMHSKILLDRVVAAPVAGVLNLAAALLGKLLRRNHSIEPDETRHVVVAKLVGMGSIIQASPLLRSLRKRFPQARLTFVTLEGNRVVVERLGIVDEIWCLDDSSSVRMASSTLRTLVHLMRGRVDHYFDLEVYSSFAAILALCSLARNRGGFYRFTARYRLGVYTHLVYFNTRFPVRRTYLQLGGMFGADTSDAELSALRVEESDRTGLGRMLPELSAFAGRPYVVINPNASDLMLERRWPARYVARAAADLARGGTPVVLIGARNEAAYVHSIHETVEPTLRHDVLDSAGRLTLGQLLALLAGARVVLSSDSGPMHISQALGRPTVCLFGPASPDHYGMERDDIETFYAAVPCSPCVHEVDEPPCHGDNVCMQRILPETVVSSVRRLMAEPHLAERVRSGTVRLPVEWAHPSSHAPLASLSRAPARPERDAGEQT